MGYEKGKLKINYEFFANESEGVDFQCCYSLGWEYSRGRQGVYRE
jgi:hypothetical protein